MVADHVICFSPLHWIEYCYHMIKTRSAVQAYSSCVDTDKVYFRSVVLQGFQWPLIFPFFTNHILPTRNSTVCSSKLTYIHVCTIDIQFSALRLPSRSGCIGYTTTESKGPWYYYDILFYLGRNKIMANLFQSKYNVPSQR